MKRLLVVAVAFVLTGTWGLPASALENEFGGYWRTRAVTQQNFSGDRGDESEDLVQVDTRTRLYYTARINDELSFVNKFEFDTVWGDDNGGDVGSDAVNSFEIKNSYMQYKAEDFQVRVGIQPMVINRGFFFDDDFSGAVLTWKQGGLKVPFVWAKLEEGQDDLPGNKYTEDHDFDLYLLNPGYTFGIDFIGGCRSLESASVKGVLAYAFRDKNNVNETTELFFLGVDADMAFKNGLALWFTGIYETGDYREKDIDAFFLGAGGKWFLGSGKSLWNLEVHGEAFLASGEDDGDDVRAFTVPEGQDYDWAEIMGGGIFDEGFSEASPGEDITDVQAFNLGCSVKPTGKLRLKADLWYARLDKEDRYGNDELGWEVDLQLTYKLLPGLKLDVVAAYLFAGDATSKVGDNSEDPYEIGTRLKLSF